MNPERHKKKSMSISLLLFTGEWCHACKQLTPVAQQVAREFTGQVELKTLDIAGEADLAAKYEVMSIPAIIIIKDGKATDKITGFISKENLIKRLGL